MNDSHAKIWEAVNRAIDKPCKIVAHGTGTATLLSRIRSNLQALMDAGGIADGEYPVDIMVGARRVTLRVCVQADLFGSQSFNLDARGLDES